VVGLSLLLKNFRAREHPFRAASDGLSLRGRISLRAGFSLPEALVALAVATLMVAVLARFVVEVRTNAREVRQQVFMDILGTELLERYSGSDLKPGRIDGRSGPLAWQIHVTPITYSARAQSLSQEPMRSAPPPPPPSGFSLARNASPDAKPQPKTIWNPYHVTVTIVSPSGRRYAIDTVRIAKQTIEEDGEGDKRR
jgi:type II secretory pathway pseudopilin PulG